MKTTAYLILSAACSLAFVSCTSVAPVIPTGNVEGLERQSPVTQDPNSIADALNARNAVDYSEGRRSFGSRFGFGRY